MNPHLNLTARLAAAAVALWAAPAAAADALGEAQAAYAKIAGYTAIVNVHEIKGKEKQDRVYRYSVQKPHRIETEVLEGPGKGSGGTWDGGETVSGHQGGLLRGLHLTVSIHDPRATSLRGDTIPSGSIDAMLARAKDDGELSESSGTLDGTPADLLVTKMKSPAANGGITREVLYLSKSTHLPIGRDSYEGDTLVKTERVSSLKPS